MKITKKQKEKLLLIGYMILVTMIVFLARDFFAKSVNSVPTPFEEREQVEIDFSPLEEVSIGEMEVWEPIPPLEGDNVGRENPFIPLGGRRAPVTETE